VGAERSSSKDRLCWRIKSSGAAGGIQEVGCLRKMRLEGDSRARDNRSQDLW
jgi:hypothetical protein